MKTRIPPPGTLLCLLIPGEPCPKKRPRLGRGGTTYTPAATKYAESVIAWLAAKQVRPPLDDPDSAFWMVARFHCMRARGPDIDNLVKLVMDALSPRRFKHRAPGPGLLWRNDRQVVSLDARRHDASRDPRTEVLIGRIDSCLD
jgi:Holliday junction resolvase RusA-like endonuclease